MATTSLRRVYGVLGFPVVHSLSPAMHNAAFTALSVDAEYRRFEVSPESLGYFFSSVRANNIYGFNVTIPHKETVMGLIDTVSDEAKLIGAVNTVKVWPQRLEGYNTDGDGFLQHLKEEVEFSPVLKEIAVLGAGGAARAVSVMLAKSGPRSIVIYDIDQTKRRALAEHLRLHFPDVSVTAVDSAAALGLSKADLLINATPIGMKPSDPSLIDGNDLHSGLIVYDLVYNPKETKLLALAREKGCRTYNGLGMLLYQGMRSFEIWTGMKAPAQVMQQALNNSIN